MMKPDEEFEMKRQKMEEKKLAEILGALSEQDRSSIYEKGQLECPVSSVHCSKTKQL